MLKLTLQLGLKKKSDKKRENRVPANIHPEPWLFMILDFVQCFSNLTVPVSDPFLTYLRLGQSCMACLRFSISAIPSRVNEF